MWNPVSTSDLGSHWGGTEYWVRGQGAAVAKAVWFHEHFNCPDVEVSWSGMTNSEKQELAAWLGGRAERLRQEKFEERKAFHGDGIRTVEKDMGMHNYYKSRLACRADCGEKNPKFGCSKCKLARYCSLACQTEDWKVGLTYSFNSSFPTSSDRIS